MLREAGTDDLAVTRRLLLEQPEDPLPHGVMQLASLPGGSRDVERLRAQQGHALHEELVQVGREDREELDPLEERRTLVEGFVEHAPVELEPAQITIEPRPGELMPVRQPDARPPRPTTPRPFRRQRFRPRACEPILIAVGCGRLDGELRRGNALAGGPPGRLPWARSCGAVRCGSSKRERGPLHRPFATATSETQRPRRPT